MKATIVNEQIKIEFSLDEIVLLGNSLNEVCNGFELPEFEKKIGTTETNGRILLRVFTKSCDEADRLTKLDDDVFSYNNLSELKFNYGKFEMEVLSIEKNKIIFQLSIQELNIIRNALQETYFYIEDWEFHPRTGFFRDEARIVLDELNAIIDKYNANNQSDLSQTV